MLDSVRKSTASRSSESSSLLSTGAAGFVILSPLLGSPGQEKYRRTRVVLAKGHKEVYGIGAFVILGEAERNGIFKP